MALGYHSITFTGTHELAIDLAPNVRGFIAQLVNHRTGNAKFSTILPWVYLNLKITKGHKG